MHRATLLALLLLSPVAAAPAQARPDAASLEAARRFLCPNGGMPVRGQGGRCRATAGEGSARGWDRGLPPPAHRQAPCPPGTLAADATARPEAVRCLPD
jgi:hypothetical protein